MSTTITMSAPIARATLTGTLLETPPSTSKRPSCSIGGNRAGTAILATMAEARLPRSSTTAMPVSRSVATARNGIARSSKSSTFEISLTRSCKVSRRLLGVISPLGSFSSPSLMPILNLIRNPSSSCLRLKDRSSLGARPDRDSFQSMFSRISSSSSAE